jgi:hypothetical protein
MKILTRDILPFYKLTKENNWYLRKFFADTKEVGLYSPFRQNVVNSQRTHTDNSIETIDEDNTYEINYIGCRGEIDENSEILASGCSITFGIGVPEVGRWTNLLSKKINKNITNLGNPGASVQSICTHLIQYCMNNKMPKEIFCLMPDFFRSMVIVDKEFYKSRVNRGDMGTKDNLEHIYCNPVIVKDKRSFFLEIEDQKYIEDSTSPHQLILNSINFIYILEAFCLSNNIKLYWTTWNTPSSYILEELSKISNFKLKNFTSFYNSNLDYYGPKGFVDSVCNPTTHKHDLKDHPSWYEGSDYCFIDGKKTFKNSHPGIHVQEHFADFFYNLYNEKNKDKLN